VAERPWEFESPLSLSADASMLVELPEQIRQGLGELRIASVIVSG
jgi:hypothetical protein